MAIYNTLEVVDSFRYKYIFSIIQYIINAYFCQLLIILKFYMAADDAHSFLNVRSINIMYIKLYKRVKKQHTSRRHTI